MIARVLRRLRAWRDARRTNIQVRVIGDEALRLLRLTGAVAEPVTAPAPRRKQPEAALQMDEAEVAALIEAVRSDPMWGLLRQESRKSMGEGVRFINPEGVRFIRTRTLKH